MIVLFRIGDFYETFEDDAVKLSKALGIVLTKRANGTASHVALAGFPHYVLNTNISRLVKQGFRVAVCDQVEDPKFAKGIVKREVVEVVTPGINFHESIIEAKKNNYLCAIHFGKNIRNKQMVGIAFIDITTADFEVTEVPLEKYIDTLNTIRPSELLISKTHKLQSEMLVKELGKISITEIDEWIFTNEHAEQTLLNHFKTHSMKGFGIDELAEGKIAVSAVLNYLEENHKGKNHYIKSITRYYPNDILNIDEQSRKNLEIISPLNPFQKNAGDHTLLRILDKTTTSMGARLFFKWLTSPLKHKPEIDERLNAVEELCKEESKRNAIIEQLKDMADIERLLSKIMTNRIHPKQVVAFGESLKKIPKIIEEIRTCTSLLIQAEVVQKIHPLQEIEQLISKSIEQDAPMIGVQGIIKKEYNQELDDLKDSSLHAKDKLLEIQEKERQATSIASLKVQYNRIFGYFIEVTNANKSKVPAHYERKQTTANTERFTIPELKAYEEKILNAEEKILQLETKLFYDIITEISTYYDTIKSTAHAIAWIDGLLCHAHNAISHNYAKPIITENFAIDIQNGRHPVLEQLVDVGEKYVANGCNLDTEKRMMIITGPNMAGKSSYLRQVGLIVYMAQMGSFVPATSATIGVVDKIFTRVGASDNLSQGESTFLVEMNETANILHNATKNSLILLDEIGRGTSTYDGLSLAWAITEYIHNVIQAKALFATHYHELTELKHHLDSLKNYNVTIQQTTQGLIFLHKIEEGPAKGSFGIDVAKMAGIPSKVITRAIDVLSILEGEKIISATELREKTKNISKPEDNIQLTLFEVDDSKLKKVIDDIDINSTTPIEAMMKLVELKKITEEK